MIANLLELIQKFDRPGPRYTSYPTAVEFSPAYGVEDCLGDLAKADAKSDSPLSLYVHLPFCESRCAFCACNVIITHKPGVAEQYLAALEGEIDVVARRLPRRRKVAQLHFGGGTPTYYSPADLRRLFSSIAMRFEILPDAEVAIEIDPCVTTEEHLRTLRELGFNRLSMGVQDLSPDVQAAIRRNQSEEQTVRQFETARRLGFHSINIDLIYGLPLQRLDSFGRSIDRIVDLRPDRVALYSFAHLPRLKRNQELLDPAQLPTPETKLALFISATEKFLAAGYCKIGMDHFAVPEDELAHALGERRLWRNFMGYTVRPTDATVAFGVSSISDLEGSMYQNTKKLTRYYEAIEAGRPPVEHGFRATADDLIRRDVIQGIMCNFFVDFAAVGRAHGIDPEGYFAAEQRDLGELEATGFIRRDGTTLAVTETGQFFLRNVAMVFDAYLRQKAGGGSRFSRTV